VGRTASLKTKNAALGIVEGSERSHEAVQPWQLGILHMFAHRRAPAAAAAADGDARDFRLILNYFSYGMENK